MVNRSILHSDQDPSNRPLRRPIPQPRVPPGWVQGLLRQAIPARTLLKPRHAPTTQTTVSIPPSRKTRPSFPRRFNAIHGCHTRPHQRPAGVHPAPCRWRRRLVRHQWCLWPGRHQPPPQGPPRRVIVAAVLGEPQVHSRPHHRPPWAEAGPGRRPPARHLAQEG
jgi:hypothetical protein